MHERAIHLWILHANNVPETNPSSSIFFALTDEAWPSDLPEPSDVVDLCDILSEAMGQPPLSDRERGALYVKELVLTQEFKSGRGWMWVALYVIWANRIAYVLGAAAMLNAGFSWRIATLIVATWWCNGAALVAARWARQEVRPDWECFLISTMHFGSLIALVVVSILHLLSA